MIRFFLTVFCCIIFCFASKSQITLDSLNSVDLYAQFLAGPGVNISNINYRGALSQIAKFRATGLGIDSGIVLSTGYSNVVLGPDNSGSAAIDPGPGKVNNDPLLGAIAGAGIYNVSTIDFEIVPYGDSIEFTFVFGSEEYLEYVGSAYNDAFGFFVNGPGYVDQNVALLPGTNTPVSINSVNSGSNSSYYINGGNVITQFDGRTVAITCKFEVSCGRKYNFKIAIGDAGDENWDSGVFIEAGSFKSSTNFTPPSLTATKDTICDRDSLEIFVETEGNVNIVYSPPLQSGNNVVSPDTTTTYYMITDILDCSVKDTQSVTVTVLDIPTANYTFPNTCLGDSTRFVNNTNLNTTTLDNYNWKIENGTYSNENPTYYFSSHGDYDVELVVTSSNGCKDSITQNIIVFNFPEVNFTFNNACQFVPVPFSNFTTTNGVLYDNSYVFNWEFGNGATSNLPEPIYSYDSASNYNVTLTATNKNNCISDTSFNIIIHPKPSANFGVDNVCLNEVSIFNDSSIVSSGNISNWEWNINNIAFTSQNPSYTYQSDGTYNVELIVETDFSCLDTVVKPTTIHPLPISVFNSSVGEVDIVHNRVNFTNKSTGAINYYWFFGDGQASIDFEPENYFEITEPCATFTNLLVVETEFGCLDSSTNTIQAIGNLLFYVPNSFTPDGDGVNDVFIPSFSDLDKEGYKFQIFNRWGELLFETDEITDSWDGKYKGQDALQGVYIWKVNTQVVCELDKKEFKGHVTLIR